MAEDEQAYLNRRRQLEAANQALQAERARRNATEARLEQEHQRRIATETRLDFSNGLFYAKTSDLWKVEHCELVGNSWVSFQRENNPDMIVRGSTTVRPYLLTREASLNDQKIAAELLTLRSESSPTTGNHQYTDPQTVVNRTIWPCDFAGNTYLSKVERAHLLPAGKVHHEQWCGIAAAVLGLSETVDINVKLKATRGTKANQNAPRDAHTGVVHFLTNRVLMRGQAWALDGTQPKLMLLPCLTLTEAKNWNRGAYNAIALAGSPTGSFVDGLPTVQYHCNESSVYRQTGLADAELFDFRQCASAKEIRCAHKLLQTTIMALADHVKNFPQKFTHDAARSSMMGRQSLVNSKAIPLPADMDPPIENARNRVCLVSFGSHGTQQGHPAPDPLLLIMKAAVIWCYMTGLQLIANGENIEEEDDDDDDDEFLDHMDHLRKYTSDQHWASVGWGPPTPVE